MKIITYLFLVFIGLACNQRVSEDMENRKINLVPADTVIPLSSSDSPQNIVQGELIKVNDVTGHELVAFAQTLIGIPYKYASTDPSQGFDCSGFITYVFSHFNIVVPRSSIDFTNVGKDVGLQHATEGDLILFTGTIDSIRIVGHMGIVTENENTLKFIHSTSGKANGVTISELNEYYKKRFVKVIRVFSD